MASREGRCGSAHAAWCAVSVAPRLAPSPTSKAVEISFSTSTISAPAPARRARVSNGRRRRPGAAALPKDECGAQRSCVVDLPFFPRVGAA
jgi:hypothetical protein